jgi:hypothetical protein
LGTLGVGNPDLHVDLRVVAEHVLLTPASPATTAAVRDALLRAADAMESTDGALHGQARSIDPTQPLIEQQATVHRFFRASAELIRTL